MSKYELEKNRIKATRISQNIGYLVQVQSGLIKDADTAIIANLDLIRKELVPNCKHPKKMHDTCQGQKYCMTCNMDL